MGRSGLSLASVSGTPGVPEEWSSRLWLKVSGSSLKQQQSIIVRLKPMRATQIPSAGRARGLRAFFTTRCRQHTLPATPVADPEPILPESVRGKEVLVIDDDPIMLKTAALKLERQGIRVRTAADGAEAIQRARESRPDLILLDLAFPPSVSGVAWTGYLIMSWLRRMQATDGIPVIVVSSSTAATDKERSLAEGALGFFLKPLDYNSLLTAVADAMSRKAIAKRDADFQI